MRAFFILGADFPLLKEQNFNILASEATTCGEKKLTKFIEIFKPGNHIAADGSSADFSDAAVADIADSYNPDIHEAPVVVGHPKTNAPAFGWIKSVVFDKDTKKLKAVPGQMNPDFVEAVKSGAYKKISVSLYGPESPNNPLPGHYYLRHVGFLGAQPPAIKGLQAVEFAENEQTLDFETDFSERDLAYNDKALARVLRNLKNFFIDKFSQEEADRAISEYDIEGISSSAEQVLSEQKAETAFAEAGAAASETPTVPAAPETPADAGTPEASSAAAETSANEELAAEKSKSAALKAELDSLKAEQQAREDREFVEEQIKTGHLLPANKQRMLEFMASLSTAGWEFSENDSPNQKEFFKKFVAALPVQIEYAEVSGGAKAPDTDFEDAEVLAAAAEKYRNDEALKGRQLSFAEAVREVKG
nr:MAG TPA: capsid scaffolding protein [Caudoviricetes sp.]